MSLRLTADGPRRSRSQGIVAAVFAAVAIVLLAAGLLANVNRKGGFTHPGNAVSTSLPRPQSAVAPLNLVKPLSTEQAVEENKERPFDATPDTAARQFKLRADGTSRDRALECLTQAVYYEAATEGVDGQRAVAQVILNRMRHPGFPSTICGVVYQGSELPTGCQFTFTCNGSLARIPIPGIWARARKIALDALAGHVFAAVGHATHYHADYVLPYWADSLAKQVQIGHHIFYRLKGGLGTDAAFSQGYGGKEPDLSPSPSAAAIAAEAASQAQTLLNSGLVNDVAAPPKVFADAVGIAAATERRQVLLADAAKGTLVIDSRIQPVANAVSKKRSSEGDCAGGNDNRIQAVRPDNFHSGVIAGGC